MWLSWSFNMVKLSRNQVMDSSMLSVLSDQTAVLAGVGVQRARCEIRYLNFDFPLPKFLSCFRWVYIQVPHPQLLNPGWILCAVCTELQKFSGARVFDLLSSVKPQAFWEHCADERVGSKCWHPGWVRWLRSSIRSCKCVEQCYLFQKSTAGISVTSLL